MTHSYELTEPEDGFAPTTVSYHRRWVSTILFAIIGLVLAFATYKMVMIALYASAVAWVVVAVFGIGSLLFLGLAKSLSEEVDCPACGKHESITSMTDGDRDFCYNCQRFQVRNGETVTILPIDTVEEEPSFGLEIPHNVQIPPVCTACGKDATHAEPLEYKNNMIGTKAAVMIGGLLSGNPTLAMGGGIEANLPAPYCDEHNEGAILKEVDSDVLLGVRSYRFARAYCQLNGKQLKSSFKP